MLELQAIERRIAPALAQQFVMPAGLDHRAVLDKQDAVRMDDGCEPVRDGDRGAAGAQNGERLLHMPLGFRIERRGRLVEQNDRCVAHQRARDRDALALPAGELQALLADLRVITLRERRDEIMRMRRLGGGDDLVLARPRLAQRDVVADRAAEQIDVLAHIGELMAQRLARARGDVLSVDQDRRRC